VLSVVVEKRGDSPDCRVQTVPRIIHAAMDPGPHPWLRFEAMGAEHNPRKGGTPTATRKHSVVSLRLFMATLVLFLRPRASSGSTCAGNCSWILCVCTRPPNGTWDVCGYDFGQGWTDAAPIRTRCAIVSGLRLRPAPNLGVFPKLLF